MLNLLPYTPPLLTSSLLLSTNFTLGTRRLSITMSLKRIGLQLIPASERGSVAVSIVTVHWVHLQAYTGFVDFSERRLPAVGCRRLEKVLLK